MILTAHHDRADRTITPASLHSGLDRVTNDLLGRYNRRSSLLRRWQSEAQSIHARSLQLGSLSDKELASQLDHQSQIFRRRAHDHEKTLAEAFALIVEASERTLGMRQFPEQILGALIIHHGGLAEMATGEGKSLTATLPAIVTAWTGRPCHIITSNDYLAARDAEELAPLYQYCQVSSGWVGSQMPPHERRDNYARGVVYVTSKELLSDFLRDRLLLGNCHQRERRRIRNKLEPQHRAERGMVMRGIDTAIVDEADSILIDEAVTPLIISQPQKNRPLAEACRIAVEITEQLSAGHDYLVDNRYREIRLTRSSRARLDGLCTQLPELWHGHSRREELLILALTAKEFYHKGQEYVVEDDTVIIVDEFTGRMMPQRTWRQGLHQMIEAKESVPLSDPSETLVRLSFQRFFRFFRKLAGMSGTAREAAGEFWHIYALPVLIVPTNRPCLREKLPARFYVDQENKWGAICDEVKQCHHRGQPVLVGTRSIAASERLAELLDRQGIPLQLLNAVKHRQEAKIIAAAGQFGSVTIATNMAGRGADIKLGKGVAELGGLHVIVSEPHESERIDRQLSGRSARQGTPGSVRSYSCWDDKLLQNYGPTLLFKNLYQRALRRPPKRSPRLKLILSLAQHQAERKAFQQRQTVMRTDTWLTDALSFVRSDLDKTS